jgi:glycosyltransferase involved in cell wall biosynthesis
MRIGMLADIYKPHVSGITNYLALSKTYLEKAGHEVFIFTFGDENYPDTETNIIRSQGLPLTDTGYHLSLSYKAQARKLLYSMDIVHVHHPFVSGTLALRYCRPRGIPIVFTNHTRYDLYAQVYMPILPDIVGETIIQGYLPPFCRACDLVIAPSEGLRQVLLHLGVNAPMEVVPNGVNLKPYAKINQRVDRSPLGFKPDQVVLVYVGRLGPEKNLPFLLRSFAGAAAAYETIRLLLIGDGPERDNLQDLVHNLNIDDKVHFTGMVPYEELPGFLASADAFVTASVTEVHPLSVIEAMAAGLPVLGIISPGISDTIEDRVTGFLASNDLASFTAKMVLLVTDGELRSKMGEQARQASSKYDINRTTQLMIERYTRLVNESRGRKNNLRTRITQLLDNWHL